MINRKTLKSLAFLAGMSFIGFHVSAQAIDMKVSQDETARIKANVNGITSDQENKILTVEEDYTKGLDGIRTYTGNDDKEVMKKEVRDTRDSQIKAILTTDQYAQYVQMENNSK